MRLLIMGPPGAGKGTQAAMIGEHYNIPAISTGNIFRAMRTADTPLAEQVRGSWPRRLRQRQISNQVVVDRLEQADAKGGLLLDGYPRTVEQVRPRRRTRQARQALDAVVSLRPTSTSW